MTALALALGRRELAAHPSPYRGLTCAQTHVRRHVHDTSGDVLYPMPDGCAACGREWFATDEITYMGYCGDCWPGSAMLLDITDGVEAVPATYPQPRRHREPAQGRATIGGASAFMDAIYKDSRWDTTDEPVGVKTSIDWCYQCGWLYGRHAFTCPLVSARGR